MEPNTLWPLRTDTEPPDPASEKPPLRDKEPPAASVDEPDADPPEIATDPPDPPEDDPPNRLTEPPSERPKLSPATTTTDPPGPVDPEPPDIVATPPTAPAPAVNDASPPVPSFNVVVPAETDKDEPNSDMLLPANMLTVPADPTEEAPVSITTEPVEEVLEAPVVTDTAPAPPGADDSIALPPGALLIATSPPASDEPIPDMISTRPPTKPFPDWTRTAEDETVGVVPEVPARNVTPPALDESELPVSKVTGPEGLTVVEEVAIWTIPPKTETDPPEPVSDVPARSDRFPPKLPFIPDPPDIDTAPPFSPPLISISPPACDSEL